MIIIAKKTYQTSEDTWERSTVSFIGNDTTTLKEIVEWAKRLQVDENTIQLLPETK